MISRLVQCRDGGAEVLVFENEKLIRRNTSISTMDHVVIG